MLGSKRITGTNSYKWRTQPSLHSRYRRSCGRTTSQQITKDHYGSEYQGGCFLERYSDRFKAPTSLLSQLVFLLSPLFYCQSDFSCWHRPRILLTSSFRYNTRKFDTSTGLIQRVRMQCDWRQDYRLIRKRWRVKLFMKGRAINYDN